MGMCALGDIFQMEVDKVIGDIKGVKKHIDNILFLIRNISYKHIEQPREILVRLRASGLKINAPKCSFGLKDIP